MLLAVTLADGLARVKVRSVACRYVVCRVHALGAGEAAGATARLGRYFPVCGALGPGEEQRLEVGFRLGFGGGLQRFVRVVGGTGVSTVAKRRRISGEVGRFLGVP